jgi:hypothetical protein
VRSLLLLLAALAATLATGLLGPAATLGATALAAQNRAGAFNPPSVTFARGPSAENPCSHLDSNAPGGGVAVGCFVGDEDAAALDAAEDAERAAPDLENLGSKIERQMQSRGWTAEQVQEAFEDGDQVNAVNKATGNPATRYIHPGTGQSVVVDNGTGQVVHVGGPGF